MQVNLPRNISKVVITEVRTADPALMMVEVGQCTCPSCTPMHFVPVVGFCSEITVPLCTE